MMNIFCIYYILNGLLLCLALELSLTSANTSVNEENNENSWTQIEPENSDNYLASNSTTDCGIRNANKDFGFIVGGTEATAHSYPWAIALYFKNRFSCGGTIISKKYVLCAAHCVTQRVAKNFQIRAGAHKIPESGKLYEVKSVKVHPNYDASRMDNDIALFEVNPSFDFENDPKIRPACLPPNDMDKKGNENDGKLVTVIGWGTMFAGGKPSPTLRQVQVPIIPRSDCVKMYGSMITKNQICAGYQQGGKDSCQGDSGGSLCTQVDKKYYQLGITSWGKGCADKNAPGVYTRVTQYLDWISKNTV